MGPSFIVICFLPFCLCAGCRYPHNHNSSIPVAVVQDGLDVVISQYEGDYLAKQAPWQELFQQELMPAGLTAAEEVLGLCLCVSVCTHLCFSLTSSTSCT